MTHLETNRKILAKLWEIVSDNPELRFGQILFNFVLPYRCCDSGYTIADPFYEESLDTLNRIIKKYDNSRSST